MSSEDNIVVVNGIKYFVIDTWTMQEGGHPPELEDLRAVITRLRERRGITRTSRRKLVRKSKGDAASWKEEDGPCDAICNYESDSSVVVIEQELDAHDWVIPPERSETSSSANEVQGWDTSENGEDKESTVVSSDSESEDAQEHEQIK